MFKTNLDIIKYYPPVINRFIMKTVYIAGLPRCGLGNHLFQIAVAIHYAEKYGYKIILVSSLPMLYGTGNMFNKRKCYQKGNNTLGYDQTILSKFTFITPQQFANLKKIRHPILRVNNHLSATNIITPTNGQDLEITGFSQALGLFRDVIPKFPHYFNYHDPDIISYITDKYGDISNGVCLCIRKGDDFKHMIKLTTNSYTKALDHLQGTGVSLDKLFIIADVPNIHKYFDLSKYNYVEVDESDIVQLYFGIMCKHYILSESTFHLWMAYLGSLDDPESNVICFNNTDITNRNLALVDWIKIDY